MVSSQVEIFTYWHVCNGEAPCEAWFCVYPSLLASTSVTRVEWVPARGPTFSMPCQSLAVPRPLMIWKWFPSYCTSQAHMRSSPLNTNFISVLSLLVLVSQTLTREQTLLFPSKETDLGELKSGQTSKFMRVRSPSRYQLIQIWACFPVF